MTIPGYQDFFKPFLEELSDGKEKELQELYYKLSKKFDLSEEEINELLPSGRQSILHNRIGWARTYLKKAGLINVVSRGVFNITEEGFRIINDSTINRIDNKFLMRYEKFREFKSNKGISEKGTSEYENDIDIEARTPNEIIEENYMILKQEIEEEIINKVFKSSPAFFEKLVVELLVSMGYGGSILDAGKAIGKSGDGGIDGIIKEDVLGLEMLYIQAKRWKEPVSRPEIQKFSGSLEGLRARKGVFITTSKFTSGARDFVKNIEKKIILIDGNMLTDLMFKYNVGVLPLNSFNIKRLDGDFFEE